ncbi:MAG: hypothetical protein WA776_16340 [Xanthobacteraceae bacterium]
MTAYLATEIDECREHAAHCARMAMTVGAEEVREDFLRLEQSWLQLARSYEFARRMMGDSKPNDNAA